MTEITAASLKNNNTTITINNTNKISEISGVDVNKKMESDDITKVAKELEKNANVTALTEEDFKEKFV